MVPSEHTDPQQVGPYRLLTRLGTGGLGPVHLGRSHGGRLVAVRLVRPELARDEAFRARFSTEIATAKAASGAFTAPVVDADPGADTPWMATLFVPGISLAEAVRIGGPLPETALLALAAGVAEALAGAHGAGLTHRDLRPGKVILALDGPHLIDFGIARAADGTRFTGPGRVLGSPAFLAPEQVAGRPAGAACDLFALGATLAFAAGGSRVFGEGTGAAARLRVRDGEPDLSELPAGLRPLVAACLAENPDDRPTSRQAVGLLPRRMPSAAGTRAWLPAPLITAIQRATEVMAPPEPSSPPGPSPAPGPNRRRLLLGLAAGAVAGGGVIALVRRGRSGTGASGAADGNAQPPADLKNPGRVLATGSAAKPLWTAATGERLLHLTGVHGTVVAAGTRHLWAFDRQGRTRWGPLRNRTASSVADLGGNPVVLGDGMAFAVDHPDPLGVAGRPRMLRAVDLGTGTEKWALDRPDGGVGVAGAHAGPSGLVYVTGVSSTRTAFVWAVDPRIRKVRWTKEFDSVAGQFLLMAPSSGDHLVWRSSSRADQSAPVMSALDAEAGGAALWQQPAPGGGSTLTTVIDSLRVRWSDGPHCSAGELFLHLAENLYAVDPGNGQVAWSSTDGSLPVMAVVSSPRGESVYEARVDAESSVVLRCLDSRTGAVRWAGTVPGPVEEPVGLQCADGNLYLWSTGRVVALNAARGSARWTYEFAVSVDAMWGTYAPMWAGGGRLYAGSDEGLVALDADGG